LPFWQRPLCLRIGEPIVLTVTPQFDKAYWESHWMEARHGATRGILPNPHVGPETADLVPGTALDAGCGEGAEALFLADAGWRVTAVDISAAVLARAAERASSLGPSPQQLEWVEADLSTWQPGRRFDLVTTHYAHPAMPQLAFYERIADWVAPGGTLLIVGHRLSPDHTGHGHHPPEEATATVAGIRARLVPAHWEVVTAEERTRTVAGRDVPLFDVVVRATRRP